jgi:hypothetical protein
MRINEMIKSQQPQVYEKLNKKQHKKTDLNLNTKDIEELMHHSFYRRGRGGAKRQVR